MNSLELRWKASVAATAFHAADVLAQGQPFVDSQLDTRFAEVARRLRRELSTHGAMAARIWMHVGGLASDLESNAELAERALYKATGQVHAEAKSRLAGLIGELEAAVSGSFPELVNDLILRGRPIREQWEAVGPGLLRQLARLTDERVQPEAADVVLVYPVTGGGGRAFLPYNRLHFEAVLTNPEANLPETLRLAWLLAQLNLELPVLGENVNADRLPLVGALAMIPPTLAAAETLELSRLDTEHLQAAVRAWRIPTPPNIEPIELLENWWETCRETSPAWSVALMALDRMLG